MSSTMTASAVLDREFLEIRARILELAACLDRLDRSDGEVAGDPRLAQLHDGLRLLLTDSNERAEQVQMTFSRSYDPNWPQDLGVEME